MFRGSLIWCPLEDSLTERVDEIGILEVILG